jgi:hypothetical protein
MTQFNPGDRVFFNAHGVPQSAIVVESKPSGIVYVRRVGGPMNGRKTWMHAESLIKEAA